MIFAFLFEILTANTSATCLFGKTSPTKKKQATFNPFNSFFFFPTQLFKSYLLPENWNRKLGINRIRRRNSRSQILWAFICYKISRKSQKFFFAKGADECPIIVYHKFYCIHCPLWIGFVENRVRAKLYYYSIVIINCYCYCRRAYCIQQEKKSSL